MALEKSTELKNGVTASYYRISELLSVGLKIRIKVCLYLDQAARVDGASPIQENCFQNVIGGLPKGFSFAASSLDVNLYHEAYEYLKTLPMFDGAIDV